MSLFQSKDRSNRSSGEESSLSVQTMLEARRGRTDRNASTSDISESSEAGDRAHGVDTASDSVVGRARSKSTAIYERASQRGARKHESETDQAATELVESRQMLTVASKT